jgi:hypothetical protein
MRPPAAALHGQGDAEVGHHGPADVEQDVLRLDVPVDDAAAVRVVERVGDLGGDPHRSLDAELRLPIQLAAERLAFEVRHHIVEESLGRAGVEQWRMCRWLRLAVVLISATNRSAPNTAASSGSAP